MMLIALIAFIFILGAMISWLATWLAVRKYLRIRTDLLYT
jgi:cell division protein FtsX